LVITHFAIDETICSVFEIVFLHECNVGHVRAPDEIEKQKQTM